VWCDPWAALHISYATHRQYLGVPESKTAQSIPADSNSFTWRIQQSTSPWAEPGITDKTFTVWMHCLYSCNVRLFCCVNAVYELVALSVWLGSLCEGTHIEPLLCISDPLQKKKNGLILIEECNICMVLASLCRSLLILVLPTYLRVSFFFFFLDLIPLLVVNMGIWLGCLWIMSS